MHKLFWSNSGLKIAYCLLFTFARFTPPRSVYRRVCGRMWRGGFCSAATGRHRAAVRLSGSKFTWLLSIREVKDNRKSPEAALSTSCSYQPKYQHHISHEAPQKVKLQGTVRWQITFWIQPSLTPDNLSLRTWHIFSQMEKGVKLVVAARSEFIQVILRMMDYIRAPPQRCPNRANNKIYTKV